MKNLQKMLRVLELVWLAVGFVGLAAFVYAMVSGRRDQGIYFLVLTFVSGVMFAVRRRQRKRAEADTDKHNNSITNSDKGS
jgi:hypothetical protein